jgi:hypothetical protein
MEESMKRAFGILMAVTVLGACTGEEEELVSAAIESVVDMTAEPLDVDTNRPSAEFSFFDTGDFVNPTPTPEPDETGDTGAPASTADTATDETGTVDTSSATMPTGDTATSDTFVVVETADTGM